MKYLVLQRFNSFGKFLFKGDVVDDSEIRSPSIRQSEGKIIPAVSSLEVPVEFATEDVALQATSEESEDKEPEDKKEKLILKLSL